MIKNLLLATAATALLISTHSSAQLFAPNGLNGPNLLQPVPPPQPFAPTPPNANTAQPTLANQPALVTPATLDQTTNMLTCPATLAQICTIKNTPFCYDNTRLVCLDGGAESANAKTDQILCAVELPQVCNVLVEANDTTNPTPNAVLQSICFNPNLFECKKQQLIPTTIPSNVLVDPITNDITVSHPNDNTNPNNNNNGPQIGIPLQ